MRTKKEFSFDEEQDALEIIENGFDIDGIDYGKMYTVAKYFREKEKLGAVRLERKLIEFCKKHDENFNPIVDASHLKKWINSAMNYNLRKIDDVSISKKDIEFLKTIETDKERRILFATLVLSKSFKKGSTKRDREDYKKSDNYYIRYSNFSDIIRLAELTNTSEMDLTEVFNKYKEHFLFYYPEKELIKVEFIDPDPQEEITIEDLDNPLKYYTLFFGDGTEKCEVCGRDFNKKSNRQKYCSECALEIKYKQVAKYKREKRKTE